MLAAFSLAEQHLLAIALRGRALASCAVVAFNSADEHPLYRSWANIGPISRPGRMNCRPSRRGPVGELLAVVGLRGQKASAMIAAPLIAALLVVAPSPEHRFDREIAVAITSTRDVFAVPPSLVRAMIRQESSFRARAESRVGARGLMLVMPANAARLGVAPDELWQPDKNILAGVRLLAVLLDHYQGDLISALVAYNARARPLPKNRETPRYVLNVLASYEKE